MEMGIFVCILFLVLAIVLTFYSGVAWDSRHEYGWKTQGTFWAIFFGVLAFFFYIGALALWIELGAMKVETKEVPVVERKITHKECIGVIESDTLYVFKFE